MVQTEQPTFLSKNAGAYCARLKNALQLLHTAIREIREGQNGNEMCI